MSCIVSGVISCCMIDRVWYMRAVLSTRSTVSAVGRGRRGIAMTGGARDARGWVVELSELEARRGVRWW